MTTNSPETQSAPEVTETLEQRLEKLEKENAELKAENERLKSKADQGNLKGEIVVNRLYGFGKLKLNKAEVDDTLKNLDGEHKTKIEDFIKNDKIEDLQKYLNSLIDSGTINKDQLVNSCNEKGIWLRDGHISEDGKFGPQTFEAIKSLSSVSGGGSENYTIENILNRKTKLKKVRSVSDLPEGYKWNNPENYDESKEDTYPTVYSLTIDGKNYYFYDNGRCKTPEGMKNSKDVVEGLKTIKTDMTTNDREYEGNLADGFGNTLQSHMEEKFKDLLKLSDNTEVKMSSYKTISFRLSPMQVVGSGGNSVVPQVTLDPRKFLTEDGSAFADERIQNIVIPDILKKLSDKKKTIVAYNALKGKKYDRKAIFSDTEFNALGPNDQQLVKNYFNYFDDGTLEFNYDTPTDMAYDISGDRANLKLRLDDNNGDEDWNKRNNNSNLIFSGSEIVGDDFKLNEDNLKGKLRDIILKAIKREDFK